jgi:glutamate-1-semialdehyde aminotransferase
VPRPTGDRSRRRPAWSSGTTSARRVEYLFRPERPVTGSDAAAGGDPLLDRLLHLYALNRGVLLTPFHNMALMSPATTEADVDLHTEVFGEIAGELTAG